MNRTHSTTALSRLSQRTVKGFSLVELMVALLIGIFVMAGLGKLFVATQQGYLLQGAANFLQENLRIVADRLSESLRMADFWGGNPASAVQTAQAASVIKGRGRCDGIWATSLVSSAAGGGGVYGYDGGSSFPFDTACIGGVANYATGSDVLVVRHAGADILAPGPVPAPSKTIGANPGQVFLLAAPAQFAQLFAGGAAPAHAADQMRAYVYAFRVEMYYLRPCHVPVGNATVCSASADGGLPLPTLMRLSLQSDGQLVAEPIVEGVEQMTLEYGIVDNAGNGAPQYYRAGHITPDQWARVTSVRVTVVVVDPTRDVSVPHDANFVLGSLGACRYSISTQGSDTAACNGLKPYGGDKPWQFMRRTQQFVVQLRNRHV